MPVPEPAAQASRILAMQRNIVFPAKMIVSGFLLFYLFHWHGGDIPASDVSELKDYAFRLLQDYFIFFVIFNGIAAILLILRRFPPRLVQWVVFTVGLVDGLLLAGLTVDTDGFASPVFWVFPGLIVVNALSIPLATPQIVLNLFLCACYVGAGFVEVSITDSTTLFLPADRNMTDRFKHFVGHDIINLNDFASKLKQPAAADHLSRYIATQLSTGAREGLSNYHGGTNAFLQQALADSLNHIIQSGPLYESNRFLGVALSSNSVQQTELKPEGLPLIHLNRALLLEAYTNDLSRSSFLNELLKRDALSEQSFNADDLRAAETGTEPPVLRLIILLMITASCYGVQLLSFRQHISDEEERKSSARNDELKAAGRLAAEIAHQLKNPLGIINNAAFSLQRGLNDGRNDFSLQIGIIREEIDRADQIITQLMGYAQLSEGRVEKLDLVEELDRAVNEVFPPGAEYEVEVHRDYGANLPALLMQRSHLSVALVNLLQNAREAMHGKGRIDIIAHYGNADTLRIVVSDTGPGISPDKLNRVFEAYFTSKSKGTGLGLAIVKHNIELYGGAVRVESELGKGARFVLLFPAKTFVVASS